MPPLNPSLNLRRPAYLPHLDGLRAVALLGVLLFHFKVPPFSGGFAGVDVFLSLSGFLITRNIISSIRRKEFSLYSFYNRRFFRLYPASVATISCMLFAAYLIFPSDLAYDVCVSALASFGLSANVAFHARTGYFDSSTELKPLLHMWSLSLEEQYYLIWPVLTLFFFTRNKLLKVVVSMGITSFILAVSLYGTFPAFVFFELPPRLFQFFTGVLLAVVGHPADRTTGATTRFKSAVHEIIAVSSMITLFVAYCTFTKGASPAHMSLVSIATVAIIYCHETLLSKWVLSNKFVRTLGHHAYSAYLVHWPLYVYVRFVNFALDLGAPPPVFLLLVTAILSVILRQTVEEKLRKKTCTGRSIFLAACSILAMSFAVNGLLTSGFIYRTPQKSKLENFPAYARGLPAESRDVCVDTSENYRNVSSSGVSSEVCRVGDLSGNASRIYVFGDSFTNQLRPTLHAIGLRRGLWFELHYSNGCRLRDRASKRKKECDAVHDHMWDKIAALPENSAVFFSNSWWWATEEHMEETLTQMNRECNELKKLFGVISEPPGIHEKFANIRKCSTLLGLPIGKIIRVFRSSVANTCGDPDRGLPPYARRAWESETYRKVFDEKIRNGFLVDLFNLLCRRAQPEEVAANGRKNVPEEEAKWMCNILVNETKASTDIFPLGYARDLRHINLAGSYFLADVVEEGLFGDVTRRKGTKNEAVQKKKNMDI